MDGPDHATAGDHSPVDTVRVPSAGRVVARTVPAAAVLVVVMPMTLWWLLGTPSVEPRTPWWPVLLIGLPVLFHVVARLTRAPRPRLPQVPAEMVHCALVSAARTGAVPSDPQVRTAAGVTACRRIEAAVHAVAATAGVLVASLVVPQPSWAAFAVFAGVLAVLHLVRARHSWACLRALHPADRAG